MSNQLPTALKVAVLGKEAQKLASTLGTPLARLEEADVAIFIVSAHDGIARAEIDQWHIARELYIPSVVVISETDSADLDFDDMSAIASKMLDPVLVRYLVIYSESGEAVGLLDLATLKLLDYSTGIAHLFDSDDEHKELAEPFKIEYEEMMEGMENGAFEAALLFPALPWIEGKALGLDQLIELLNRIPTSR